jgi:hypothetical protein
MWNAGLSSRTRLLVPSATPLPPVPPAPSPHRPIAPTTSPTSIRTTCLGATAESTLEDSRIVAKPRHRSSVVGTLPSWPSCEHREAAAHFITIPVEFSPDFSTFPSSQSSLHLYLIRLRLTILRLVQTIRSTTTSLLAFDILKASPPPLDVLCPFNIQSLNSCYRPTNNTS